MGGGIDLLDVLSISDKLHLLSHSVHIVGELDSWAMLFYMVIGTKLDLMNLSEITAMDTNGKILQRFEVDHKQVIGGNSITVILMLLFLFILYMYGYMITSATEFWRCFSHHDQ